MPKSVREVPKEIAAFGERQFKETGAAAVEVLRVKAAVMRKHFRQLRGITYLVAVVARDCVRIYFFNAAGVMLVGENVESEMYQKVRASSKLVAKFEKPRELTPEELRIEATQELRDSLAKGIRRVTRFLATTPPTFPDIFVTRSTLDEHSQNFGLQISEDNEFLFEESALKANWFEGLILRTAFLAHLGTDQANSLFAWVVGNGVALALLKDPGAKVHQDFWSKISRDTEWSPIVNHLVKHAGCYSNEGFARLFSLLRHEHSSSSSDDWMQALMIIHDGARVSIGTEEYHTIRQYCQTLSKPRKMTSSKNTLDRIHLSPRVICDPSPLGIQISMSSGLPSDEDWASVSYFEGNKSNSYNIGLVDGIPITGIDYWLNLEDVYPTSGGLVSHGKSVLQRALASLGVRQEMPGTFETSIEFSEKALSNNEKAVLERLILGQSDILANTLVGSPQIIESLLSKGAIVFLPFFNHIGLGTDFVLKGDSSVIRRTTKDTCLEATTFHTNSDSLSVVSAPTDWKLGLLQSVINAGISIWPVKSVISSRNIIRCENAFKSIN